MLLCLALSRKSCFAAERRSLCIAKDFNRALRSDTNPKHGLTNNDVKDPVVA